VVACLCLACFPLVTNNGWWYFLLLISNIGGWVMLLLNAIEAIVIIYIFGYDKLVALIKFKTGEVVPHSLKLLL